MALMERLPRMGQIQAEKARRSLRAFFRAAWGVVEPATPYVPGWHLDAIADHLEAVSRGEIRSLLINMPPRHMKSLAVSVFWPCWEWLNWPERRWLFASYAQSLSIRDSLKCRRLIMSPWYQSNYAHIFQLVADQNQKSRFENDRSGYRLATSVDASATGEGGDRIVVDDPHNVRDAASALVRESTLVWWDEAMTTRLNNPQTGARIIVMQRVHEQDLSGHLLAQGGWEHLCLPAEYEGEKHFTSIGWSDPREATGELLWPERFDRRTLDDLKRSLGSYGTAGQLQQRPAPAAGGILKRDWWKYYTVIPEQFDMVMQSWDLTFKDAETSDYVVGQVWGAVGPDRYLLDQVRARLDFPATIAAVRGLSARWPGAIAKIVEDKANGPAVIATLQREIVGMIPVNPQGSKEARAHSVAPMIEAGNVYLPDPTLTPWVDEFIHECASFPFGAHDDQVDAMTQALIRMHYPGEQEVGVRVI